MDFTGERYVPKLREAQLSYEHWHRYLYASRLVKDRVVLDLACGEGYGAYLMSSQARKVVGADIDPGTVRVASSTYIRENLEFVVASATALPADWTGAFDAVISFETIEHIGESEQRAFLDEVKRVLKPDGLFVVSTPNKLTYTDIPGYVNPFHVKELYVDEYRNLLHDRFANVRVLGQKVSPVSYMWEPSREPSQLAEFRIALTETGFRPTDDPNPFIYAVAICSDENLDAVPTSVLVDVSDALTQERESGLQRLTEQAASLTEEVQTKSRVIDEGERHVAELTASIEAKDREIQSATAHVDELTEEISKKQEELDAAACHVDELTEEIGKKQEELDAAAGHVEQLTERLADRDRILRTLAIHSGRAPEQLRDEDEIAASLDAWIESARQQVEDLRAQLQEREQSGVATSGDLMDLRRQLAEKERVILEYSAGLAGWEAHWAGVQRSLAWRFLVVPVRGMRRLVAPENSFRERLWFRMWGRAPVESGRANESGNPANRPAAAPPEESPSEGVEELPPNGSTTPETDLPSTGQALEAMAKAKLRMFLAADGRLTFPVPGDPRVSVVIPLYNQAHFTLMTLEALLASEREVPYEVILVDNGSSDETLRLLRRLDNVRVHRFEANQGFGEACNRGAEMASGEYICFLNNDALPGAGWLTEFIRTAERFPACGAVGGKLVLPDGRLQEAGSIIWEDGSCLGYGRGRDPLAPEFCYTREVDYCSAACLMVRRDLFLSLGKFDSRYAPAYYEDSDLCMALRQAGYTVMFDPKVTVLHMEHGSSGRERAIALQIRNRDRFADKWRAALVGRGMPGATQELLSRDSRKGTRLLVIDDRVPESRRGSGFPRTYALLTALCESGYVVTYLPTDDQTPHQPVTAALQDLGVEVLYGGLDVACTVESRPRVYDAAIVSRPHNARFIEVVRQSNPGAAIIYDAEAVFALREVLQADVEGRALSAAEVEARIKAELAPVASADLVLTVSEVERAAIQRQCPDVPVKVWGHAMRVRPPKAGFAERQDLVFVGYLASEPNNDAVLQLLREILPRIRKEIDCHLTIVGTDPSPVARLEAHRLEGVVTMPGYVDDLSAVLDAHRIFVAPHRFAAGIPHKVHEAMSRGVPCVVSPLLADQLGVTDGVEALVGVNLDDFAAKVVRLYQDGRLWEQVQHAALQLVRDTCNPDIMRDDLKQWIEDSVRRRSADQQRTSLLHRVH